MMTNPDPEDYDQSPHRIEILTATYDLWERLKTERPELREKSALRGVVLKCAKRHNIIAIKIRTVGMFDVDPNVNFEVIHALNESDTLTADSRPTATPDTSAGNVIADLERVTIQCPKCRIKSPNRKIVVKADRLLLNYAAALARGQASIIIE